MISHYIVVGLGGAIGSIARVVLGKILPSDMMGIPLQILLINVLGCFSLGVLIEVMALNWSVPENMKYFLVSGVLGGFTTFSAFALEFGLLYEKNLYLLAIVYVFLSVVLSMSFFFIGIKVIRVWL